MAELIARYVKLGIAFVLLWVLAWLYNNIGCRQVPGQGMVPMLSPDKHKFIYPKAFRPHEHVHHDDIVYYEYEKAGDNRHAFVARVIGLPGDRIRIEKGEVSRNGAKIGQAYIAKEKFSGDSYEEIIVPRDSFFLLMDNRTYGQKYDSRDIGPVGQFAVVGKVSQ